MLALHDQVQLRRIGMLALPNSRTKRLIFLGLVARLNRLRKNKPNW